MAPDFLPKLAEHGTLGLLLGIALWVTWQLYKANQRLAEGRLVDAQQYAERTVRLVETCTAAITAQTHVTEGHKKSFDELHATMREYLDEVRRSHEVIREYIEESRRALVSRAR